jgi:hypothetical protein
VQFFFVNSPPGPLSTSREGGIVYFMIGHRPQLLNKTSNRTPNSKPQTPDQPKTTNQKPQTRTTSNLKLQTSNRTPNPKLQAPNQPKTTDQKPQTSTTSNFKLQTSNQPQTTNQKPQTNLNAYLPHHICLPHQIASCRVRGFWTMSSSKRSSTTYLVPCTVVRGTIHFL